MNHLEQDHDNVVASDNQLISISLAHMFSCIARFVRNDGAKKHFTFMHGSSEQAFRLNVSGKNNKF